MKTLYYVISLILVQFYFSCSESSIEPTINNTTEVGHISLSINMANAPSDVSYLKGRLIRADHDTVYFDFTMENDYATALVEDLLIGDWFLNVDAYDTQDIIIYTGSTDITILAGQTITVQLHLNPITGRINIVVIWGDPDDYSFSIHFLKDSTLSEADIVNIHIDSLELKPNPWLADYDIRFYDFSSHCIYLKSDKSHFFKNYTPGSSYFIYPPSQPFVVVADSHRCYIGALHSGVLSLSPSGPFMFELDVGFYPADVMHISRAWSTEQDIRNDSTVADVLIRNNLYHPGLDIELTSFQIINNADTATVEYTIVLSNNDQDNLYIIDPLKMGSKLFHYFTNGPVLWNPSMTQYISSEYKKIIRPDPYDSWDFDWFTLIESNQSIERTIQLKGYPYIPHGNYNIYMNFDNPKRIDKASRIRDNGRIWIGDIRSNIIGISI